mgnify:CR=1 FL=1
MGRPDKRQYDFPFLGRFKHFFHFIAGIADIQTYLVDDTVNVVYTFNLI